MSEDTRNRIVDRDEEQGRRAASATPRPLQDKREHEAPADVELEVREVRAADPELSPELNARLTDELRTAVDAESVEVPVTRPHATRGEREKPESGIVEWVTLYRIPLAVGMFMFLGIAAILVVSKVASWWILPLAAGVHAIGAMSVALIAVGAQRELEHPSPQVVAAMAAEGVTQPDQRFSEMVGEFRAPEPDELHPWENERSVSPLDDPATAGAQQSRSMTPSGGDGSTESPGNRTTNVFLTIMGTALCLVAILLPALRYHGWLWLLPAVLVPPAVALMALSWLTQTNAKVRAYVASSRGMWTMWGGTVAAVIIFCVLVALELHGRGGSSLPSR